MKFSQLLRFKSFSILDLTRKTKFLTFNLRKFYQSKILDSNSLMFSHKKEIDRHQKFLSKMKIRRSEINILQVLINKF